MRFTPSILYITFTKYTKVPRLELSHEYKRLEILAKFTKSKDFKKKQNINLFWSRSSDAALIVNFPHRFWLIRTVHECFSSFADYIHEWTNLNSVFNAGSLDIAKKNSKTTLQRRESSLAAFAIFAPWTTKENSTLFQLLSNLRARRLVIPTHLLDYESPCFHRQLFRSPRAKFE